MRLREVQVSAPNADQSLRTRLSVMSEVICCRLDAHPPIIAPFAKILVTLPGSEQVMGATWVLWPGGIGEFRALAPVAGPSGAPASQAILGAVDSAMVAAESAGAEGASEFWAGIRAQEGIADGGPFAFELHRLACRDRKGRSYRTVYSFSTSRTAVTVSADGVDRPLTVHQLDMFVPLDLFFPATSAVARGGQVEYRGRGGSVVARVEVEA